MKYLAILATALLAACGNGTPPAQTAGTGKATAAAAPAPVSGMPGSAIKNPDFEQTGADGQIPGWTQTQHAGPPSYAMTIDSQGAYAGRGSFHMKRTQPQEYGSLEQTLDARPFAGKTVELSAMLKSRDVGPKGWKLYISAQLPGTLEYSPGLTGDTDWRRDAVRLAVPARATQLTVGVTLLDGGEGWMDDVTLKAID